MNDGDEARETLLDLASSFEIFGHVLVAAFTANEASVERVYDDRSRLLVAELGFNVFDELVNLGAKVDHGAHQIERRALDLMVLFECLDASCVAAVTFKGEKYHRRLLDFTPAIFPSERDMEKYVHCPELLSAFGWPPDDTEAS